MGLKLESPLLHEWASFTMKGDSDMLKISRTKALAKALVEDVQQCLRPGKVIERKSLHLVLQVGVLIQQLQYLRT